MATQKLSEQGGLIILHPIQIADERIYGQAMDIIERHPERRSAKDFVEFNNDAPNAFLMEPIHTKENPIVMDESHIALVWRDKDEPENVDLMVAIIMEIEKKPEGGYSKKPCGIIAGDKFQGVVQYRCPCCGDNQSGFSMMFFIMDEDGKIGFETRDTLATKAGKEKLFEKAPDGVRVDSHQIEHIVHHHLHPEKACGHDHSHLPQAISAQHTRRAPK